MGEYAEQVKVMDWHLENMDRWPCLKFLFHSPNGGWRDIITASRMKRAGSKRGVPDLFLPHSNHLWHGLWIEMKHGKNKQTKEQVEWEDFLESEGFKVVVCYSANEAIKALKDYLALDVIS